MKLDRVEENEEENCEDEMEEEILEELKLELAEEENIEEERRPAEEDEEDEIDPTAPVALTDAVVEESEAAAELDEDLLLEIVGAFGSITRISPYIKAGCWIHSKSKIPAWLKV